MNAAATCSLLLAAVTALAIPLSPAALAGSDEEVVPVMDEPAHVVRYRSKHFIVYTNQIPPGSWTLDHWHEHDLLAVVAGPVSVATRSPGSDPVTQHVPAGTVSFFPYSDHGERFVHRLGVLGENPFLNVGLEFEDPLPVECSGVPAWDAPGVEAQPTTRRGRPYRLVLAPGAEVPLPAGGRALLLVSISKGRLTLGETAWEARTGSLRFNEDENIGTRPPSLRNDGDTEVTVIVFNAC